MTPGEIVHSDPTAKIPGNTGLETHVISVTNTGDRLVQVGSHFHFFEVNTAHPLVEKLDRESDEERFGEL
mgnify:CR=1 FL=1